MVFAESSCGYHNAQFTITKKKWSEFAADKLNCDWLVLGSVVDSVSVVDGGSVVDGVSVVDGSSAVGDSPKMDAIVNYEQHDPQPVVLDCAVDAELLVKWLVKWSVVNRVSR